MPVLTASHFRIYTTETYTSPICFLKVVIDTNSATLRHRAQVQFVLRF